MPRVSRSFFCLAAEVLNKVCRTCDAIINKNEPSQADSPLSLAGEAPLACVGGTCERQGGSLQAGAPSPAQWGGQSRHDGLPICDT